MTIALCNVQEFNPTIGGIERASVSLASQLIKVGMNVVFISCRKSPYSKKYSLPARQYFLPSSEDYASENVKALRKLIEDLSIDVLINQNAHSYLFHRQCIEAIPDSAVKLVSVLHFDPNMRVKSYKNMLDSDFFTTKELVRNWIYSLALTYPFTLLSLRDQRRLYRALYKESDRLILLSKGFFPAYKKIAGIKEDKKIEAVPNMLSFPLEDVKYPKTDTILFCARMTSQKNPYRALKVWKMIQDRLPGWKIKFVGDGPWRERLEKMAAEMELNRVEFLGFKSPVEYYKEAKIFLLTSNFEGWGLTLTEAMQYGCVPVAFDSFESIHEIIDDGKSGFLVRPFDLDEMADKILLLAQNSQFEAVSENTNTSAKKFLPEIIVKHWVKILKSL